MQLLTEPDLPYTRRLKQKMTQIKLFQEFKISSLLSLSQKITVLIREHVYQIRTVEIFGPLKNCQYY